MKKSYPFPLISFCRKGPWENSGLPNAILQALKERSELRIESYDSKNISTDKDPLYKDFLYKINKDFSNMQISIFLVCFNLDFGQHPVSRHVQAFRGAPRPAPGGPFAAPGGHGRLRAAAGGHGRPRAAASGRREPDIPS